MCCFSHRIEVWRGVILVSPICTNVDLFILKCSGEKKDTGFSTVSDTADCDLPSLPASLDDFSGVVANWSRSRDRTLKDSTFPIWMQVAAKDAYNRCLHFGAILRQAFTLIQNVIKMFTASLSFTRLSLLIVFLSLSPSWLVLCSPIIFSSSSYLFLSP